MKVLAILPTAAATEAALFVGDNESLRRVCRHPELDGTWSGALAEQVGLRRDALRRELADAPDFGRLDAVVSRGGLMRPLPGGTYLVNDLMLRDLEAATRGVHVANLGAPLAREIAADHRVPAFVVDPVSVDEMDTLARFSGLNGIDRVSLSHALNTKAAARRFARTRGVPYAELRLIVAHLGGGVSVSAHAGGRMIDVNHSADEGPFGLTRAGGLPAMPLIDTACAGAMTRAQLKRRAFHQGGLFSYLGTADLREVQERIQAGDPLADSAFRAMIYQVAKEVGAMAAVLSGRVDAVIVTGPMVVETAVVHELRSRIDFVAPLTIYPGEDLLRALAEGASRVLDRTEELRTYE